MGVLIKMIKITYLDLALIAIIYIGISSIFPPLYGYLENIDTTFCICMNILLLMITFKYMQICYINKFHFICTIFFLFYLIFIPFLLGNLVWTRRYISLLFFITAPLMFRLFDKLDYLRRLKKCVYIIGFFASITYVQTITALIDNPYLSRSIKSNGDLSLTLKQNGIGGYEFIYFCVIIGVILFLLFKKSHKLKFLVCYFLMILIIILSNYMTALILLLFGTFLCLLYTQAFLDKFITIFILLIIFLFSKDIINLFITIIENLSHDGRIGRLLLNSNENLHQIIFSEFVIDRLPVLVNSFNLILDNLVFGILAKPVNEMLLVLGQHSFILDTIAIFGIPISLIYFYNIFRPLQKHIFIITVLVVILSVINNVTNSIALSLYIIAPLFIDANYKKKSEEFQNVKKS